MEAGPALGSREPPRVLRVSARPRPTRPDGSTPKIGPGNLPCKVIHKAQGGPRSVSAPCTLGVGRCGQWRGRESRCNGRTAQLLDAVSQDGREHHAAGCRPRQGEPGGGDHHPRVAPQVTPPAPREPGSIGVPLLGRPASHQRPHARERYRPTGARPPRARGGGPGGASEAPGVGPGLPAALVDRAGLAEGLRGALPETPPVRLGEAPGVEEAARVRDRRDGIRRRRGLKRLTGGLEPAVSQELHGGVATVAAEGAAESRSAAAARAYTTRVATSKKMKRSG